MKPTIINFFHKADPIRQAVETLRNYCAKHYCEKCRFYRKSDGECLLDYYAPCDWGFMLKEEVDKK